MEQEGDKLLIAYAGWKMLGIYPEVKGKTNLHPVSVGPVSGVLFWTLRASTDEHRQGG